MAVIDLVLLYGETRHRVISIDSQSLRLANLGDHHQLFDFVGLALLQVVTSFFFGLVSEDRHCFQHP